MQTASASSISELVAPQKEIQCLVLSKVGMFALSHAGCCRRNKQIACGTLFAANMYWKCYSRREGTRNAIDDQNALETLLRRTTWQPSIGFPVILVGSWGGRYDRPQIVVCNTDTKQETGSCAKRRRDFAQTPFTSPIGLPLTHIQHRFSESLA